MDGIAAFLHNVLLVRDKCEEYANRDTNGLRLVRELGPNAPSWTKRDRRRLAFLRGEIDGFQPPGRMDKYHAWLYPHYGESKVSEWYKMALATAVASNQAALLEPKLSTVKKLAEKLIDQAHEAASDGIRVELLGGEAGQQFSAAVMDLELARQVVAMVHKPSGPEQPAETPTKPKAGKSAISRPALAQAAVIAHFSAHPESDPTAEEIGEPVGLDAATIRNAPAWKLHQRGKKKSADDIGDGADIGDIDENLEQIVGKQKRHDGDRRSLRSRQ